MKQTALEHLRRCPNTEERLPLQAARWVRGAAMTCVLLGHSAAWLEPEAARELGESIDRLRDEWRLYS